MPLRHYLLLFFSYFRCAAIHIDASLFIEIRWFITLRVLFSFSFIDADACHAAAAADIYVFAIIYAAMMHAYCRYY